MSRPSLTTDTEYCATLVRDLDRDRYIADLFAPAERRGALFALHAFNAEVSRVREAITNPMAGEVRLQWWSEALTGGARGDVRANPVAAALLDAIEAHHLPRESLVALIDARIFDLYDDPMPTVNDLEGYAGETASAVIRLAALVLAPQAGAASAEAAGHAGVACAVTGLLRSFPRQARRGQCYVPLDLLKAHGLTREDAVSGRPSPALDAALGAMRGLARRHYEAARAALAGVTAAELPAFLPLMLVPGDLARMERPHDPFAAVPATPALGRLWQLWRGAAALRRAAKAT
ncbi:phytoene/squalene synthase family protein [Ancylobacter dichloromethanicus]|uniref:Phytoene synthase n=1 Tax=Ancylobacter dichloromethanicus TaxID=518825 RepID=A0A9W6J5J9_9HYPH|nr:phytoene/squalene synthase family protein [Ancylobacter dichloromethanicus]MBS7554148.1 phytoene/squalene synthase family protein [Ancylobacter dichloromethanicus]GLK71265.1 phytoene synthase [Ancylobacter dichloromethanicus]